MKIDCNGCKLHFAALNEAVRNSDDSEIVIDNCVGQRYIGAGSSGKKITVNGTPGNALGAYLDGSTIEVNGNAQDALGDTMNGGRIVIRGSAGDAAGYAMRGGEIFIEGDAGYRAGIHMKAYKDKLPVLVVGGCCGSFLGEYQAGGIIIVLGESEKPIAGFMCGTGMHGGKIFMRGRTPENLPSQVVAGEATEEDKKEIESYVKIYCELFNKDFNKLWNEKFYLLVPDTKNPYKQLYTNN